MGEAEEDEGQGGVVRELPEYTEIQVDSLLSMQVWAGSVPRRLCKQQVCTAH